MHTLIRLATIDDMPRIHELITELAVFEKEPDAVEISVDYLKEKGFGKTPAFTCFVAEHDGEIGGMAIVYPRFSTWKGVALHLEDLIVSQSMRGKGLGEKLLNKVIEFGNQMGVKRIGWEVLDWNEPAINFYEKRGAKIMRDWDVVQLDEQGIKNYLNNIDK